MHTYNGKRWCWDMEVYIGTFRITMCYWHLLDCARWHCSGYFCGLFCEKWVHVVVLPRWIIICIIRREGAVRFCREIRILATDDRFHSICVCSYVSEVYYMLLLQLRGKKTLDLLKTFLWDLNFDHIQLKILNLFCIDAVEFPSRWSWIFCWEIT